MSRPSSSVRARRRAGALGLVAAALLMTACQGSDAGPATAPAPAGAQAPVAPASIATAPVPPPPVLSELPSETPAPAGGTAEALAAAHARLEDALSKAGACTADAQCRSLPVGGKACGGPTGYRAYSSKAADPASMQALAQQEHDLALQEARESHRVSNCMMLADPGARCVANRCETGGPQGPRSPATR